MKYERRFNVMDVKTSENGFYKLLTETYKLNISDDDFKRITTVLDRYNIEPGKLRIMLEDSVESFINNLHLIKSIECTRVHTRFDIDELIFILHQVPYGFTESINITFPVKVKHNKMIQDPEILKMPQNIAVIRTLTIEARKQAAVSERFSIIVYNDELNVVAGIRFENIE
jgi:hypothetical protein